MTVLVDAVILLTVAEIAWLAIRRARADTVANAAAGLALMLALRLALGGAGWPWLCGCLAAAGIAHGRALMAIRS